MDSLPVRMSSPEMIDLDEVAKHIIEASGSGRYDGPTEPMAYLLDKKCLVQVGEDVYPTLAGLLCFGRNPQELFPNAVVDLGHYGGVQPVSYDVVHLQKNVGGTIFKQIEWLESYLWRHTRHGMTLSDDGPRRVELHEYPRAVIRELSVNMLAHRDYTVIGSAARALLFRDRIEWISPGGLPPGVTEENLLTIQQARNSVLLSILYEAGYVEGYGMGLDTVVTVLEEQRMSPPVFRDLIGAAFVVTVYGRPIEAREQAPYLLLNDTQRRLIQIIERHGEASLSELRDAFPDRAKRTVQEDISGLVEAGIVERSGQTKATRYRLRADTGTPTNLSRSE